jgi:hypothetical protein
LARLDGRKTAFNGKLVERLFNPLLERYEKNRVNTRKALLRINQKNFTKDQMEKMGIFSLLNQKPDVVVSKSMLEADGFLTKNGVVSGGTIVVGRTLSYDKLTTDEERKALSIKLANYSDK